MNEQCNFRQTSLVHGESSLKCLFLFKLYVIHIRYTYLSKEYFVHREFRRHFKNEYTLTLILLYEN